MQPLPWSQFLWRVTDPARFGRGTLHVPGRPIARLDRVFLKVHLLIIAAALVGYGVEDTCIRGPLEKIKSGSSVAAMACLAELCSFHLPFISFCQSPDSDSCLMQCCDSHLRLLQLEAVDSVEVSRWLLKSCEALLQDLRC
jgi:hypothetical protein